MDTSELAVILGGLAALGLAVAQIVSLHRGALQAVGAASEAGAAFGIFRQVFLLLIVAAVALVHTDEVAATALGFTLSVGFALFLLLQALEHIYVPEVRRRRAYLRLAALLFGAACFLWGVAARDY